MDKMSVKILKERYASGETPRDIVNEIINLSSEYQDRNIWIVPPDMRFIEPYLKVLDHADRSLPLWGIPFAVKDNIDVVGLPTTAGLQALSSIPEKSAEVVSRLVCAGAIPVGKTNLDQLATGLTGTRSPYGECKNAVTPEYISGGSSSGSAVAAALGLCSFALGTDTGGSVRVPAALNGIYGFKPYIGAYPKSGIVPACESIDCVGLLARSLDDISAEFIRQLKRPGFADLADQDPHAFAGSADMTSRGIIPALNHGRHTEDQIVMHRNDPRRFSSDFFL